MRKLGWICLISVVLATAIGVTLRFRARKVPPHVLPEDRAAWPTGNLLFQTDVTAPERQWLHHPKYQDPKELVFENGTMKFHVKAETADEWAYLYLDPARYDWADFSWQTTFRRLTHFQEYAFNFRYVDFDNRYRYRFEDDYLFFDLKYQGKWYILDRAPLPMAMGAWYDLRIDARGTTFRCYVNGTKVMENEDSRIRKGSICVILWECGPEAGDCSPVNTKVDAIAEVGPSKVFEVLDR